MESSSSLPQLQSRSSLYTSPRSKLQTSPNRPITGTSMISTNSVFSQSATTLTRSVIHWSFSKSKRFNEYKNDTSDVPIPNLGSTLSPRATTQGFGGRSSFKPVESPPPNAYDINSHLFSRPGPIIHKRLNSEEAGRESWDCHGDVPGPGKYEISRDFLAKNKGFLLKSRCEPIDARKVVPAPNHYAPRLSLTYKSRFSGISFGFGGRYNFTPKEASLIPGPGTYELPSKFNKKNRQDRSGKDKKTTDNLFLP
ncbi:unnamed protein product [Blepharisma stoltei]|uniref:Uncharacterized protein n=1 Tax=Blepharisma stoltei TaxID=1481888 RepID=A0AAU9JRS1_9CILI|nr:unnamed protein product [Blepharisma stoltei]